MTASKKKIEKEKLKEAIKSKFDLNEIRALAFDLDINYEELAGNTLSTTVISLIEYAIRHKQLNELRSNLIKTRSEATWEHIDWSLIDDENFDAPLIKTDYQHYVNQYLQAFIDLNSEIQILGQSKPKLLEEIFTDVYMLEQPTSNYDLSIDSLERGFQKYRDLEKTERKRVDGFQLAQSTKRLFVTGRPGSGKTTFLKFLALKTAQNKNQVPIFISLNQFVQSQLSLFEYIVEQFDYLDFPNAETYLHQLLRSGKALVLFDGLDEAQGAENLQPSLHHHLDRFIKKFRKSAYIISCRIGANQYTFQRFTYVEIASFTEEQIEELIHKWLFKLSSTQENFHLELSKTPKGVKELANTPLLISLFCIYYELNGKFPKSKLGIYQNTIENLLIKWDQSRLVNRKIVSASLANSEKLNLLSFIAYSTFVEKAVFFPKHELEKIISKWMVHKSTADDTNFLSVSTIIDELEVQHGFLTERAQHIYSFSHLTLQEYFVADYIIIDSSLNRLRNTVTIDRILDPRWQEVFLFIAESKDIREILFDLLRVEIKKLEKINPFISKISDWIHQMADMTQQIYPAEVFVFFLSQVKVFILAEQIGNLRLALESYLIETSNMLNKDCLRHLDVSLEAINSLFWTSTARVYLSTDPELSYLNNPIATIGMLAHSSMGRAATIKDRLYLLELDLMDAAIMNSSTQNQIHSIQETLSNDLKIHYEIKLGSFDISPVQKLLKTELPDQSIAEIVSSSLDGLETELSKLKSEQTKLMKGFPQIDVNDFPFPLFEKWANTITLYASCTSVRR